MARQNLTKALALLLAVMMLIGLTACAKTPASSTAPTESKTEQTSSAAEEKLYYNKTGYPICDTPLKLTAAGPKGAGSSKTYDIGSQGNKGNVDQLKYYYDHLGLDLVMDVYSPDDWKNQLTMLLTTDNLPDMIWNSGLTVAETNKYGAQNYFADINKYDELLPNLNAFCELHTELKPYCTDSNGAMYGMVRLNNKNYIYSGYRYFLNRSFMENLKAEVPTTLDEFYKLLIRFRDEDANGNGKKDDEIPFQYDGYARDYTDKMLFTAFGVHASDTTVSLHVGADGKVTLFDDNYKAYLKFLCQLYDEGLMDKNAFVLSTDESRAHVKDNLVGAYPAYAPFVTTGSTIDKDTEVAVGMVSLASEYTGNKNQMMLTSPLTSAVKFSISEKSEYKEACVRLLDYLYTEEGMISTRYGVVGEQVLAYHDDVLDIDMVKMDDDKVPADFTSSEEWRNSKVVLNEVLYMTNATIPNAKYTDQYDGILEAAKKRANNADSWKKAQELFGWSTLIAENVADTKVEFVDAYPSLSYPENVMDERTKLLGDLKTTMTDGKSAAIIGGLSNFDANWDKLVKDMESSGLKDLLKIEQDAYDAMKK